MWTCSGNADCGQILEGLTTVPSEFCPHSVDISSRSKEKTGERTGTFTQRAEISTARGPLGDHVNA